MDEKMFVTLNVGGKKFTTAWQTLAPSEYFSVLRSRWTPKADDSEKEIWLDRDPHLFKYVLSLLRNPHYDIPDDVYGNVMKELEFFQVPLCTVDVGKEETPVEETLSQLTRLTRLSDEELEKFRTLVLPPLGSSMAGGLTQIAAQGVQDRHRTCDPTAFISCLFSPEGSTSGSSILRFKLHRVCETLHKISFIFTSTSTHPSDVIRTARIDIGGNPAITIPGPLLNIFMELKPYAHDYKQYWKMRANETSNTHTLQLLNKELAELALVAMQFHECHVTIELNKGVQVQNPTLHCRGKFLDTKARHELATQPQIQPIFQYQDLSPGCTYTTPQTKICIHPNHPITDFYFFCSPATGSAHPKLQEAIAIPMVRIGYNGYLAIAETHDTLLELMSECGEFPSFPLYHYHYPDESSINGSQIHDFTIEFIMDPYVAKNGIRFYIYAKNRNVSYTESGMFGIRYAT